MQITTQLAYFHEDPSKEKQVKQYLLACCEKLIPFRSSGLLSKSLPVARLFLLGCARVKTIRHLEWQLEGEIFRAEYLMKQEPPFLLRVDNHVTSDLARLRAKKRLSHQAAQHYLMDMTYFIDEVFLYIIWGSTWYLQPKHEKFLCPRLYIRYFGSRHSESE